MPEGCWMVSDGLFLGSQECAMDLDFIVENKVTRIINCCGSAVSNSWEMLGVVYLTFPWEDDDDQAIFDEGDAVLEKVFCFIEEAHGRAEATLVHSIDGENRSYCLLVGYMMKKYSWAREKALDFLASRRPDAKPKPGILRQLVGVEKRLQEQLGRPLSAGWDEVDCIAGGAARCEELVLRNTYLNCSLGKGGGQAQPKRSPSSSPRIRWSECLAETRELREGMPWGPDPPRCSQAKSVLKGSPRASGTGTIAIRTKKGTIHCSADEIVPRRLGLQLLKSRIILEYAVPKHGLRAHHPIVVDASSLDDAATAAALRRQHAAWLAGVSVEQLTQLVARLRSDGG